jgi:hypothetical protein
MKSNEDIVRTFWKLFNQAKFDDAGKLLSSDCNVYWPNTKEIFKGRDKFILANKVYPGRWFIDIKKIFSMDNIVISVVRVYSKDKNISFYATSFFKFKDGLISEIEEYYGQISEPPQWRIEQGLSEKY